MANRKNKAKGTKVFDSAKRELESNHMKTKQKPPLNRDDVHMIREQQATYHSLPTSVVSSVVRPGQRRIAYNTAKLVDMLHQGLPVTELESLQESLDIPMEKLLNVLGISKSTLHRRRKTAQRLDTPESDRVLRFARLMRRAVDVMESHEAARLWLKSPQIGLGGTIPLDYAQTEVGAREVEDLLGRIEYSVYS